MWDRPSWSAARARRRAGPTCAAVWSQWALCSALELDSFIQAAHSSYAPACAGPEEVAEQKGHTHCFCGVYRVQESGQRMGTSGTINTSLTYALKDKKVRGAGAGGGGRRVIEVLDIRMSGRLLRR